MKQNNGILIENKHRRTMQNICLVTTQSVKRGKSGRQNMETFKIYLISHHKKRKYIYRSLVNLFLKEMQINYCIVLYYCIVRFHISCLWISCLSRRIYAINWRKTLHNESLTTHGQTSCESRNGRPVASQVLPNSVVFYCT